MDSSIVSSKLLLAKNKKTIFTLDPIFMLSEAVLFEIYIRLNIRNFAFYINRQILSMNSSFIISNKLPTDSVTHFKLHLIL